MRDTLEFDIYTFLSIKRRIRIVGGEGTSGQAV